MRRIRSRSVACEATVRVAKERIDGNLRVGCLVSICAVGCIIVHCVLSQKKRVFAIGLYVRFSFFLEKNEVNLQICRFPSRVIEIELAYAVD